MNRFTRLDGIGANPTRVIEYTPTDPLAWIYMDIPCLKQHPRNSNAARIVRLILTRVMENNLFISSLAMELDEKFGVTVNDAFQLVRCKEIPISWSRTHVWDRALFNEKGKAIRGKELFSKAIHPHILRFMEMPTPRCDRCDEQRYSKYRFCCFECQHVVCFLCVVLDAREANLTVRSKGESVELLSVEQKRESMATRIDSVEAERYVIEQQMYTKQRELEDALDEIANLRKLIKDKHTSPSKAMPFCDTVMQLVIDDEEQQPCRSSADALENQQLKDKVLFLEQRINHLMNAPITPPPSIPKRKTSPGFLPLSEILEQ